MIEQNVVPLEVHVAVEAGLVEFGWADVLADLAPFEHVHTGEVCRFHDV